MIARRGIKERGIKMKFKAKKGIGLNDEGIIHDDPVVGRMLNGYIVSHNGDEVFIPFCVVDIIEISENEKNAEMRW